MDLKDEAKTIGKAVVLGAIEIAPGGSIVTRILDEYLPSSFDKRKNEFIDILDEKLTGLEDSVINKIKDDDSFVFFVAKILRKVCDEHERDKLEYFANLIVNTVLIESIDYDKCIMFNNILGEFTSRHINILSILKSPKEALDDKGITLNISMGGVSCVFVKLVSDYETNMQFYQNVISDLYLRHLTILKDLGTTMSYDGVVTKRTTNFGDEFLQYIVNTTNIA